MPDIAASTSSPRPLTISRIGGQIVSGPARSMVPIRDFTELMIGRMSLMGRAMDPII